MIELYLKVVSDFLHLSRVNKLDRLIQPTNVHSVDEELREDPIDRVHLVSPRIWWGIRVQRNSSHAMHKYEEELEHLEPFDSHAQLLCEPWLEVDIFDSNLPNQK
jgi:hypothetical protein